MSVLEVDRVAELRDRLRTDTAFYARNCLKIVDQSERLVPLEAKPAQLRLDRILESQADAGLPMRAIILKARKLGFSTWTAAKIVQRATQRSNHKALVVAHDKDTAGELHEMSRIMYGNLPEERIGDMALKPGLFATRKQKEMHFGEESLLERRKGNLGINSKLLVDTANEFEAGRGFTFHSLHLSEVAFWADIARKMTALLNTVPDEPGTLVVIESTANGHNHFRRLWQEAHGTGSDYEPIFFPWFEEPGYIRPFLSESEREEFIEGIGSGPWGEDEPRLVELLERAGEAHQMPERLHWRRWAIVNRCQGDLRTFQQEYPSDPEEAFLSTGRQVFSQAMVAGVLERARGEETPEKGLLRPERWEKVKRGGLEVEVPVGGVWHPEAEVKKAIGTPWWERWEAPDPGSRQLGEERPPGQYVVAVDPASGEETDSGELAYHAIEVVDHRTRRQVAEYRSRIDPDLVALEAYLVARHYHDAWLAIEITGGYGLSMARKIWRLWHYQKIYFRTRLDVRSEKQEDRLGWDTRPNTKPQLEDHLREMLRTGSDGMRSPSLAEQMITYVRDERGRTGPEDGYFADQLMAYMIAQFIAQQKPLRSERVGRVTTSTHEILNKKAGW